MISDSSVSDGGWGASCYQAMVDAAAEKGWETVYTDNVATSDYATVMTDYAELGYDLIFAPGNQYTDAVKQVAEEYPEIKFALLNGTVETDNIQSILPDAEQIGYMAGALAGLMSKTNNIGFIGGMELDTTKAKVECYEKAAQKINPDIKVSSAYAGSFSDTAKGKENGLLLYNSGISVVFACAGQSGLGVIDAAVQTGKFAIGVDSDQAEALKDSQPDMANVIITSAIKNIPDNAVRVVKQAMAGEVPYGTREVFGLAEDAVGIAENEFYEKLLSADDRAAVEELKTKVMAGEVEMTPTIGITTEKINEIREAARP